jgi:hypothetical protein
VASHTASGTQHEVRGSRPFFEMTDDIGDTLDEISDYLAQMAPALQQRIIKKLRMEGVAGRGLLGTTEGRAGKAVTDPLAQCAEYLGNCVQLMKAAARNMDTEVLQPIEEAQAARRGDDPFEIS